ncbi:MAG: acetyl-CoA carboxylase carboxyltransferase subunit alpha [Lachnospiraceae bacterium]|uniref:Acetyl-coenzyme A carboxylase carboxyl transferase subunit alpha n=1 Tax=Candidatus Weimeria bifida TaxID=2599074 RepID=A0A6N7IZR7_9FIRM|nr:acetyl-CoA carboxylase carboxyltransferase subunit alpha [Candidatus Weimeria bifida]RRF96537.1 MAG: acetyl-CoA carboxylase carboxyltransferase subunit alpha [Lachnospiraceae bacterium]
MVDKIFEQTERIDKKIQDIQSEQKELNVSGKEDKYFENEEKIDHLKKLRSDLLDQCRDLTPEDHVYIARLSNRPHIKDFIGALFTDFFEQRGDHLCDEDEAIYGGIALFHKIPVTVLGHRKGRTVEENVACRFGMPSPEGYRKAMRMFKEAEKFNRPIITFIDTPGAYPGMEAEAHGQGEAIARSLAMMSHLKVPVISVVTGEGNSGGALALSVANRILMLKYAVYSVLSPEGFCSILFKDTSKKTEACSLMHLTADELYQNKMADEIIDEPLGGASFDPVTVYDELDRAIYRNLKELQKMSPSQLLADRHRKFRRI